MFTDHRCLCYIFKEEVSYNLLFLLDLAGVLVILIV